MPAKGTSLSCRNKGIKQAVHYVQKKSLSATTAKKQKDKPKLSDAKAWKPYPSIGIEQLILGVMHHALTINTIKKPCVPWGNDTNCNDAKWIAAVKDIIPYNSLGGDYRQC
jgi:cytochrome c5